MFGRQIISFAALFVVGASAQFENPAGSIDIGTVGFSGSSSAGADPGDWLVSGSGQDIWGSHDHFHYMYFNATGDVTVTCKVNSFTGSTNGWRKGGIMFRADTGQRAAHSHLQLTGWGIAQQSRQCLQCGTISYHDRYSMSNVWLRLVKQGNLLTSYVKRDGDYGFMQYNTVEVALPENYKVGIAITSHDNNLLGTLDISNLEITSNAFTMSASSATEIGDTGNKLWVQQVTEDLYGMDAAGSGIGGTADAFGFWDEEQTGDITATTFVSQLTRHNNDSKGGLMIRTSHDVDAPHVSILVNSGTGVTLLCRRTQGGETFSKNKGVMLENVELRLEKTGNSVKALYRQVGAPSWYELGLEETIDFESAGTYYVGHAVTSSQHGSHSKLIAGAVDGLTPITSSPTTSDPTASPSPPPDPNQVCAQLLPNGDAESSSGEMPFTVSGGQAAVVTEYEGTENENKFFQHSGRYATYNRLQATIDPGCVLPNASYTLSYKVRVHSTEATQTEIVAGFSPSGIWLTLAGGGSSPAIVESDGFVSVENTFSFSTWLSTEQIAATTSITLYIRPRGSAVAIVDWDDLSLVPT